MNRYDTFDLSLTDDGDFELDADGDLVVIGENDLIAQMVMTVLKITNPDWASDEIGADLEDLLGLENSQNTADLGKRKSRMH